MNVTPIKIVSRRESRLLLVGIPPKPLEPDVFVTVETAVVVDGPGAAVVV